jgi:DNA-binding response OmpR family regulator
MEQIMFGPFRLDATTTTLLRDGQELARRPQAFHALKALIHNCGHTSAMRRRSKHTVAMMIGEVKKRLALRRSKQRQV